MNLIIKAAQFAAKCHEGQVRKWSGRDYIEHPMRVAGRLSMIPDVTEEAVAAAWLHDVIEDCGVDYIDLVSHGFGHEVASLVQALTNPSKEHPKLKRAARKEMDRKHLAGSSHGVKVIKLIDRIDNIREMNGADERFKQLYKHESELLAQYLTCDSEVVWSLICELRRELVA